MALEDTAAADRRTAWAQGLAAPKIVSAARAAAATAQAAGAPDGGNMGMVLDIPVQISVELGRKKVPIKQILELKPGSVVELDSGAGEPIDVLVNGHLIAQGEMVVVNGKFGVRLTDVVTPSERFRRFGKA
jgi:flagellar motor switch protein FliN